MVDNEIKGSSKNRWIKWPRICKIHISICNQSEVISTPHSPTKNKNHIHITQCQILQTSASKSFSPYFKEHALLNAWIRSLQRPCLGTFTVHAVGNPLPSLSKTVTVMLRVVADCRGKERYMKGSKVTETFPHAGQTKVDLYWPCQICITQIHKSRTSGCIIRSGHPISSWQQTGKI